MPSAKPPVIFIHGLWLHASSWQPWVDLFTAAGYECVAPGWPGDSDTVEACRANPDAIAGHGINDVAWHYGDVIAKLPAPAVLIGHSFGGMIAEKLLGRDLCAAAISIDAAPIKGDMPLPLPLSTLRSALPVFKNPANARHAVSLTQDQFRFSFGNAVPAEESDELYERWAIPAPGKPLFEAAAANFSWHSADAVDTGMSTRGPLLLITGGQDHAVPEAITKSTRNQYRDSAAVTDLLGFPDRGHSLTIDSGWQAVADACLSWLDKQGL